MTTVSQQHQNKVKEIKVESDEEDDLNVPKYNRETFDAIFSCKRIARGTYEFTFHPEFKKLFNQFHVVNDIDANHGRWINLCRVSINNEFQWLVLLGLKLSRSKLIKQPSPTKYSF